MGQSPAAILYDLNGDPLTVSSGRLHVTAEVDWTGLHIDRLRDSGGSADMVVDGSGTPVSFMFDADPSHDLSLLFMRLLFIPNVLKYKGATTFGSLPALSNGVEVSVTSNGVKTTFGLIKASEDFMFLGHATIETGLGENDLLEIELPFSGSVVLKAGTSDKVEVVIQDDIVSQGANSTKYFQASVFAREGS